MLRRARSGEVYGIEFPIVSPEDLIVIKALAHKETSPRHLHDVAAVISQQQLDWPYLLRRGRLGAKRVLSFIMFARSEGIHIPDEVIEDMAEKIYGNTHE